MRGNPFRSRSSRLPHTPNFLPSCIMRLLFVTSEIAPWVKTGGLGDVAAALPEALMRSGLDVRVLVPAYPALKSAFPDAHPVAGIIAPGAALPSSRILEARTPSGLILWLLDCPQLYERRGGPYQTPEGYDWGDNPLRFALLGRVAAILGSELNPLHWRPNVVHGNDWQAGLAPAYLHYMQGQKPGTVMTIHNLAFQGNCDRHWLNEVGMPFDAWRREGVEFHGHFSYLKAGLHYCDRITTVSPTYAEEIRREDLGFGMAGLLRHRGHLLSGILNGIDADVWNPAADPALAASYRVDDTSGKLACKAALQAEFGLEVTTDRPLLGVVSRLTYQKGLDWVMHVGGRLVEAGMQLAVLGSGDKGIESGFQNLAQLYPGSVGVRIGYDEALSHRIEAGADIFLMPSRFEPCGLNQMYSLRYGTPPVVRPTGGLADTVSDCTDATLADGTATGFVMHGSDAESLLATIHRAVGRWRDPSAWASLMRNGMSRDLGWGRAAEEYIRLYQGII